MEEQLVSFETFGLAVDKSFDNYTTRKGVIKLPTQSLLQKCLREEHDIHIVIIPTETCYWTFKIINLGNKSIEVPPYNEVSGVDFPTFEKALEEGLQEALKLI